MAELTPLDRLRLRQQAAKVTSAGPINALKPGVRTTVTTTTSKTGVKPGVRSTGTKATAPSTQKVGLGALIEAKKKALAEKQSSGAATSTTSVTKPGVKPAVKPGVKTSAVATKPATSAPNLLAPTLKNTLTGDNLQRLNILQMELKRSPDLDASLLAQVANIIAEELQLSQHTVGTHWFEVEGPDLTVLSKGIELIASRLNDAAPAVVESILASSPPEIKSLNPKTDTRNFSHVVFAAAQVIAGYDLRKNETKTTQKKRNDRTLPVTVPDFSVLDDVFGDLAELSDEPVGSSNLRSGDKDLDTALDSLDDLGDLDIGDEAAEDNGDNDDEDSEDDSTLTIEGEIDELPDDEEPEDDPEPAPTPVAFNPFARKK